MKIALCMIVKNEEVTIKRCLDSVIDLVDEAWIADTGSTDKTLEILKQYPKVNILHYKEVPGDPFNYGRARNFAQSETKADAIFSLDGDEWLHPKCKESFRENVERHIKKHGTLLVPLWTHYNKETLESPNHVHSLVRLFRNEPPNKWEGRIHEIVMFKGTRNLIDDILILHDKTEKNLTLEQHKKKIKLYETNLLLMIKEAPENPRGYFYLLQSYSETGQHQKAIDIGCEYIKLALWHEERAQACIYLGKSYAAWGMPDHAESWFIRSAIEDPLRAEPWCYLGDCSLIGARTGGVDWPRAAGYFDIATNYQEKMPPSCLFLEQNMYEYLPWYRLSIVYAKLENFEDGYRATEAAMEYIPDDKDMINNLDWHEKNETVSPQAVMPISNRPVNVVIPTKSKANIEILLKSISEAKTFVPFQVTIVWDKTDKNTDAPWVENKHYEDDFIFARNVNRGMKPTCDNVILNDDTKVNDWWLDEMQAAAYHGTLGIVSPLITDVGREQQHVSVQKEGVFYTVESDFLCFVCIYLPRAVVTKVGQFDEHFIWYGYEDNDFGERVKNNGFELKITHRTYIEHKRHSTYGEEAAKNVQKASDYFDKKWKNKKRTTLEARTVMNEDVVTKEELTKQPGQPKIAPSVQIETFGDANSVHCGENVEIRHCTYIEVLGGQINIAKDTVIGAHCVLQGNGNIDIGEGTIIGPHCNIYSVKHPTDSAIPFAKAPLIKAPVIIGRNCWLGAGVTVQPGITIGDDCIIGAHSLVLEDIHDGSIAHGIPAKVTRLRNIPRERQAGDVIEALHIERYKFAAQQLQEGDKVLDACCGTGYGSEVLLNTYAIPNIELTAVDSSAVATSNSRRRLKDKAEVIQSAILNFTDKSFDVIVCFEALEHMINAQQVLTHLWSLLKPGGKLICSVPSDKVSASVNPYHVRHYSEEEFEQLLHSVKPVTCSINPQFRGDKDSGADFFIGVIEKASDKGKLYVMPKGADNG